MKLTVLGAGAVGSMFGGLIKSREPAIDVLLLARGEHAAALERQAGVRLRGPWGERLVNVRTSRDVADLAGSDVVLVTVKSQATAAAIAAAAPYLGGATVVSLQNGINDAVLQEYVADDRLVMGMTATNMAILEPGTACLQLGGYSLVGPNPQQTNAAASREAARVLRLSGLLIAEHANPLGARYNKLAINALGYASCLSQSNFITEAVTFRPWRERVGLPILEECVRVFRRAGVRLAPIPGRPGVERLTRLFRWLDVPGVGGAIAWGARRIYNRRPILFSLGQDLLRGKPTEVDFVNGEIARLAAAHGIFAPCNERVVQLVRQLEARPGGGFFERDEVLAEFEQLSCAVSARPSRAGGNPESAEREVAPTGFPPARE